MASQLGAINSINNLIGKVWGQPKGDFVSSYFGIRSVELPMALFHVSLALHPNVNSFSTLIGWPSQFPCHRNHFGPFGWPPVDDTFLGRSNHLLDSSGIPQDLGRFR